MVKNSPKSLIDQYRKGKRDFGGIHLKAINLGESKINGENYDILELKSCDFGNAVINNCNFVGSDLSGSNFKKADLTNCNFARAILNKCNFYHASFYKCNLNLTSFTGSKLAYADFSGTTIWGGDFSQTLLTGSQFYGADLKSVLLTDAHAAYLSLGDTSLINMDLATFLNARITKHK
jgi:uncharacterized protein YjbI with pentapeptide repeats